MGIRFTCPNGHKLHVKTFLAGKRGVCPQCGAKILIPATEEPQQSIDGDGDIRPLQQVKAAPEKGILTGTVAAPSIIIALADAPVAVQPPIEPVRPAETGPTPAPSNLPAPPATPAIVTATTAMVSPATRYAAHRERARRNQLTIAIALLVAVIVLALALLLVVQRGAGQSSAGQSQPVGVAEHGRASYLAVANGKHLFMNAPVKQVASP